MSLSNCEQCMPHVMHLFLSPGEGGEFVGWQGPPTGMNRMNPPRGPSMGPLGPGTYGPGLRGPPPNSSLGPGGPMPPMTMTGPGGRPQWQPNTSTPMNYSSSSPGNYGGPPGSAGPAGPGTPIMPSPQDSSNSGMKNSPANGGPGTPREDSGSGMGDYNIGFGGPGENFGACIHIQKKWSRIDYFGTCQELIYIRSNYEHMENVKNQVI
nr:unnamed protein product [Callosobruchus chinensis]